MEPVRIALVAGEASGDLLGSHLILALREHLPNAQFYGIGGPKMQAAGFESLYPIDKLSVHGYAEALLHYREISGIRRQLIQTLLQNPPQVFIGIDAPDFNLVIETRLKASGVPTIHYVSPSIWAWRGERIHKIAKAVSRILVLFPFEEAIYRKHAIPVTYVGHPLADVIPLTPNPARARERLALPAGKRIFALLPGSRRSELRHLAGPFIETARILHARFPDARFIVPLATRQTREMFELALYEHQAQDLPITQLFGHAQDAMAAADAVLVASGTATLECALLKKPMVIAYKIAGFSWRIMRRMGYLPYVGLPNVLSGRFVVPEFIQGDATPENLAQALGNLAEDTQVRARISAHFDAMHRTLKQNAAQAAASAILPYLGVAAPGAPAIQVANTCEPAQAA